MNTEELIAEAIKRYPVGTKYLPVHISQDPSYEHIIEKSLFVISNDTIYNEDQISHPSKGGTKWLRTVYERGRWATIVESVPQQLPIFN